MQAREDHEERIHQRIWELLPWYVNGTLSGPERERVEDHLPGCRRCREEVEICRQTAASIQGLGEVAPSPHPVQLQRVLARIDRMEEDEAERLETGEEQPAAAGPWFGVPRRALQALVAQAALIVLLVGLLAWRELRPGAVPSPASSPAPYQTLSDPAPPPGGAVAVRVMFSPQATEKEIRDLLLAVHGEITAGPSPLGAYTVEVTAADPVSVVLTRLRSDSLVTFAQPAAGSVPAKRAR
jgi:anti-sigma factor RsiW